MKTVFAALGGALGTVIANWRVIALLWIVNAAAGWIIAAPLAESIEGTFLHNALSADLLTRFDNEAYIDFTTAHADAFANTDQNARTAALPWILLWTVLTAGVWARVARRKEHKSLLAACGRYGFRFILILLITLAALWGLTFVNDGLTAFTTGWLVDDAHDVGAGVLGWSMLAKQLVMLGLVGIVITTGCVSRLRMIHLGERLVPLVWLRSLFSVLRHLPSLGLGRVLSLWPLVAVFALYDWISVPLLGDEDALRGMRLGWRMLVVFQGTQLLLQAALVYRMAVTARLWPIVAPAVPSVPIPVAAAPVAVAPLAAPTEIEAAPEAAGMATDAIDGGAPDASGSGADAGDETAGDGTDAEDEDSPDSGRPAFAMALAGLVLLPALAWAQAETTPPATGKEAEQDAGQQPPADPPSEGEQAPPAKPAADPVAPVSKPAADPPKPAAAPAKVTAGQPAADTQSVHRNAYVIDATLDLEAHTVTAVEQATFINRTKRPVSQLWMHLYPAAFSNTHSTWMDGGKPEAVLERGSEHGGYIDVRSVQLADGTSLDARTTIEDTVMRIGLPAAVEPDQSVTVTIRFTTRFPRVVARMGMTGNHMDGMQWYPKFCAHDENGWSNNPFHRTGEFFANFGSYDVSLHYPEKLDGDTVELEATGVPQPPRVEGGQVTKRYLASDVHDFAFCADPAFVRKVSEYRDPATGKTVEIVYLCQPYAEPKAEFVLDVVQSCMKSAGEWWMPYPYPRLVVDGLPHNLGGGMEYPMLFTISQRFPNHLDWFNQLTEDPASVTAHEFGHQYWYGILASNEVDEAFLDEGLNTWATTKLLQSYWPDAGRTDALTFLQRKLVRDAFNGAHKGAVPVLGDVLSLQQLVGWRSSPFENAPPAKPGKPSLLGFRVPDVDSLRLPDMSANREAWWKRRYAPVAGERPLSAPSRDFTTAYSPLVYNKTALVMQTLENHLGTQAMQDLMRTYVGRHKFSHPTKDDFLGLVSEMTGAEYDALLSQLIETNRTVDFAVTEVRCAEVKPLAGYSPQSRPGDAVSWTEPPAAVEPAGKPFYERLWNAVFSTPLPGRPEPAGGQDQADAAPTSWLTRYTVRQLGQVEAPVVVLATFEDGSQERDVWDGVGGYKLYEHRTPSRLKQVVVDPDRLFAIDLDVNNNGYRVKPALETTRTFKAFTHFWAQNHLNGWSLVF